MFTYSIQRLDESVRATVVKHFLALPMKDRSLRFAVALAPTAIAAYVDRIDFVRDAIFGIHDDQQAVIGVAHVALEDERAEVALSVLPAHRGCGMGGALFERAVAHARNARIPRVLMFFRWGNAPIIRIARRFGMDIVTGAGGSAEAHLKLKSPSWRQLPLSPMNGQARRYECQ